MHLPLTPALPCLLVAATLTAGEPAPPLACAIPPGANFITAEFSFWHPGAAPLLRGTIVLMPGYNGDARRTVTDAAWQDLARRHDLGLLGARFVSAKPADKRDAYSSAGSGSGQALLDALASFAEQSRHPEVAAAPLLLWGHSAGGQFNYEFTCWQPERVVAFVANKGGYYSTHLAPRTARLVPGILFVGEKDEDFRVKSLLGIYACNRRDGALWTLAVEPGSGHEVGRTPELARQFFEAVIPLRLGPADPAKPGAPPIAMTESAHWRGSLATADTWPADDAAAAKRFPDQDATVWLPDAKTAVAWADFVRGRGAGVTQPKKEGP